VERNSDFLGQIQLAYATLLLARRAPGDHAGGLALLEAARAIAPSPRSR